MHELYIIYPVGVMHLIGSLCFMTHSVLIFRHGAPSRKVVPIGPLTLTYIKHGTLLVSKSILLHVCLYARTYALSYLVNVYYPLQAPQMHLK